MCAFQDGGDLAPIGAGGLVHKVAAPPSPPPVLPLLIGPLTPPLCRLRLQRTGGRDWAFHMPHPALISAYGAFICNQTSQSYSLVAEQGFICGRDPLKVARGDAAILPYTGGVPWAAPGTAGWPPARPPTRPPSWRPLRPAV